MHKHFGYTNHSLTVHVRVFAFFIRFFFWKRLPSPNYSFQDTLVKYIKRFYCSKYGQNGCVISFPIWKLSFEVVQKHEWKKSFLTLLTSLHFLILINRKIILNWNFYKEVKFYYTLLVIVDNSTLDSIYYKWIQKSLSWVQFSFIISHIDWKKF